MQKIFIEGKRGKSFKNAEVELALFENSDRKEINEQRIYTL